MENIHHHSLKSIDIYSKLEVLVEVGVEVLLDNLCLDDLMRAGQQVARAIDVDGREQLRREVEPDNGTGAGLQRHALVAHELLEGHGRPPKADSGAKKNPKHEEDLNMTSRSQRLR